MPAPGNTQYTAHQNRIQALAKSQLPGINLEGLNTCWRKDPLRNKL